MNKLIVEFLGTALLTFVVLYTGNYLAIGTTLAIACLLGGKISGGAFNPAVAIGMMSAGHLGANELMPYIIAEMAGALVAYELLKAIR